MDPVTEEISHLNFEGREEGEKVILFLRPHAIILVPGFILAFFLLLVPLFLGPLLIFLGIDFSFLTPGQRILAIVFWYVLVASFAYYKFLFWYFNIYILTNERVIDFDFRGILHKEIALATLSHLEDVSPKTIGFFGTFFNFGNVHIQTAGEKTEFEFHHVARPEKVAARILEEARIEEGEAPGVVA